MAVAVQGREVTAFSTVIPARIAADATANITPFHGKIELQQAEMRWRARPGQPAIAGLLSTASASSDKNYSAQKLIGSGGAYSSCSMGGTQGIGRLMTVSGACL